MRGPRPLAAVACAIEPAGTAGARQPVLLSRDSPPVPSSSPSRSSRRGVAIDGLNARKLHVRTRVAGVSLLHRTMCLPPRKNDRTAPLPLMASPQPMRDLSIAMAPAEAVGARGRRGLVVPFETGGALPAGAEVS